MAGKFSWYKTSSQFVGGHTEARAFEKKPVYGIVVSINENLNAPMTCARATERSGHSEVRVAQLGRSSLQHV